MDTEPAMFNGLCFFRKTLNLSVPYLENAIIVTGHDSLPGIRSLPVCCRKSMAETGFS
jgi:hypothetical protein